MTYEFVTNIGRQALSTTLLLSAPVIGLSLVVGLLVSLFQATTQIHEQTLTFVPKMVAVLVGLVVFGPWMTRLMMDFAIRILGEIPLVVR